MTNWVAIFGEFQDAPPDLRFKGKLVPAPVVTPVPPDPPLDPVPSFGVALSNRALVDGEVSAEMTFESVTEYSVGEIVVAYDANARHIVAAGIGGDPRTQFSLREFGSGQV